MSRRLFLFTEELSDLDKALEQARQPSPKRAKTMDEAQLEEEIAAARRELGVR